MRSVGSGPDLVLGVFIFSNHFYNQTSRIGAKPYINDEKNLQETSLDRFGRQEPNLERFWRQAAEVTNMNSKKLI